jgi:Raf kinase inhibitor-like YbhB/YbcL family protein
MRLTSTAFAYGRMIPSRFTCDGVSPPLQIDDLPAGTVALVLLVEDPDAPAGTWVHWLAYDIDPASDIVEAVEELGTPGRNSWRRRGYGGPCPPTGIHRYLFRVFALDESLRLPEDRDREEVERAMAGHVLGEAVLMGRYGR